MMASRRTSRSKMWLKRRGSASIATHKTSLDDEPLPARTASSEMEPSWRGDHQHRVSRAAQLLGATCAIPYLTGIINFTESRVHDAIAAP